MSSNSIQPPRSLPHKRPFVTAMVLTFLGLLAGVGIVSLSVLSLVVRDTRYLPALIATLVALAVLWSLNLVVRRSIKCPLCRGTPFVDTGASKHVNARHLPALNYGTSALLSLLFFQRYWCMFCGCCFDLLKNNRKINH